jgi:hypothetical protein
MQKPFCVQGALLLVLSLYETAPRVRAELWGLDCSPLPFPPERENRVVQTAA